MKIILALDNIRSSYNVGSILRSAAAFNVAEVITIGITPHLEEPEDGRLPHVIRKAEKEIRKTALGGEEIPTAHFSTTESFSRHCIEQDIPTICIEHGSSAVPLNEYIVPRSTIMVVVGNEVDGVNQKILDDANSIVSIPTHGTKKSLNVGSATAIALYEIHMQFATMNP